MGPLAMQPMTLPMESASVNDLGTIRRPGKAAGAFRTISEVATDLDVPQHVLRFWETRFTQIRPLKRAGGRRYYRPEDVELLRRIRQLLYNNGYTIKGVQRLLRDLGRHDPVGHGEAEGQAEVDALAEAESVDAAPLEAAPPTRVIEAAVSELLEVRELLRRARR